MAYYLDLFSPETYEAFKSSDRSISGFRLRQKNAAERINPGDKLLCYLTKLGRWFGILEVQSGPFIDNKAIFYPEDDPFVVRFTVVPLIVLEVEKAVPIREDELWNRLSFTKEHDKRLSTWTGKIRASLAQIDDTDGDLIAQILTTQKENGKSYEFNHDEYVKATGHSIRRADKRVSVTVPSDQNEVSEVVEEPGLEVRESIRMQALIANIGSQMGLKLWIPKTDRNRVLEEAPGIRTSLLDRSFVR